MIYFNTVSFLIYLLEIIIIVLNRFVEIVESDLRRGGEADFLSVRAVTRFTVLFKNNEF